MGRVTESIEVAATAKTVWDRWAEVNTWPQWDTGLEWAVLEGTFAQGARGRLKPAGAPATGFSIVRLSKGRLFTTRSRLPLAWLEVSHDVEEWPGGCRVTHGIDFGGPLGGIFRWALQKKLASGLAEALKGLKRVCENGR